MEIYKKIQKLKRKIGKISKDNTNPFYKSKYFDINTLLEHVEPLLEENELLLLQPIIEGSVFTEIYDVGTGDKVTSSIELPQQNDPQKLGSAITYYRRYTLQSLLGLQAEDDDGNKASNKPVKQPTSTPKRPTLSQLEAMKKSTDKKALLKALTVYSLVDNEKEIINNRIKELK